MSVMSELHAEQTLFGLRPQPDPEPEPEPDDPLALVRARWTVRWLHRQGLPASADLDLEEYWALFVRAQQIAERYVRVFGAAPTGL